MLPRTLCFPLLAALACLLAAASLHADPVDDIVIAEMARRHIPGLSLAVVQDGSIVKAKGYGVSDLAARTPVTTDTLFQAASISKPVSAVGALALVETGKLKLDEDINAVLKTWHVPENNFTKENKVTLRRLLSHSAGTTVHGFAGYPVAAAIPTLPQVLDGERPANSPAIRVDVVPGSIYRYSGGGYVILQQAVIDVTGQTYPAYLHDHVLKPFGMDASTFEQPIPPERRALTATGYYPGGKTVPGRWHVYPEIAPAGLWTTPSDLARFAIGIQRSLSGQANPVISQATTREMLTVQKAGMGLGWQLSGADKTRRFSHNGRNEGFDAQLVAYNETGQAAVVMINANDDSSAMNRILSAIANAYHWPNFPDAQPPKAIEDKEPEVTAQLKQIFEGERSGQLDRALFTPELADVITPQIAAHGAVRTALASYGALRSTELVVRRDQGNFRLYRYRFIYENESILINLTFNAAGKIAGLAFQME